MNEQILVLPPVGRRFLVVSMVLSVFAVAAVEKTDTPAKLMVRFGALTGNVGKKNTGRVKILSGPSPVQMLNDKSPGQVWQASLGTVQFKVTIQDATKLR
ncbi:MAG: hypothetical protein NTY53_18535, partial [Kiritimatiellaeota bacterium]|nr:hypothetical protein [Kiritimatiellota bacterium]